MSTMSHITDSLSGLTMSPTSMADAPQANEGQSAPSSSLVFDATVEEFKPGGPEPGSPTGDVTSAHLSESVYADSVGRSGTATISSRLPADAAPGLTSTGNETPTAEMTVPIWFSYQTTSRPDIPDAAEVLIGRLVLQRQDLELQLGHKDSELDQAKRFSDLQQRVLQSLLIKEQRSSSMSRELQSRIEQRDLRLASFSNTIMCSERENAALRAQFSAAHQSDETTQAAVGTIVLGYETELRRL